MIGFKKLREKKNLFCLIKIKKKSFYVLKNNQKNKISELFKRHLVLEGEGFSPDESHVIDGGGAGVWRVDSIGSGRNPGRLGDLGRLGGWVGGEGKLGWLIGFPVARRTPCGWRKRKMMRKMIVFVVVVVRMMTKMAIMMMVMLHKQTQTRLSHHRWFGWLECRRTQVAS